MRDVFLAVLAGFFLFLFILIVAGGVELRRFLRQVPELRSESDMWQFKLMVRRQMSKALLMIVCGVVLSIASFVGAFLGYFGWIGWVLLILVFIVMGVMGVAIKRIERRVQKMPVAPELEDERRHVVEVWMKKPFPDW